MEDTLVVYPINSNTWYMGMLTVGKSGKFQVKIWERDNPAVMAVYNDSFDSSWQNLNWNFIFNNTQGELQIDNYREHDRMGYRSSMQDGSGNTEWNYDPRGNIIREIKNITLGGGSFLTQWTYNSAGLVTSLTYPGGNSGQEGEVVQYTYNKRSLLETMIGTNNYIISSQYDTNGRLIETYLQNGVLKKNYNYFDWTTPDKGGKLEYLSVTNAYTEV